MPWPAVPAPRRDLRAAPTATSCCACFVPPRSNGPREVSAGTAGGSLALCRKLRRGCFAPLWPTRRTQSADLWTRVQAVSRACGSRLAFMPRLRSHNVQAAQWSPNGGALGQADLTQPGANVYGANVFSSAVQRQRLPKTAYDELQETLAQGELLDPALAD